MSPRLRPGRWLLSRIAFLHLVSLLAVTLACPPIVSAQDLDPKGESYRPGDVVPAAEEEGASEANDPDELRDPYGLAIEGRHTDQVSSQVRYVLEGIVVTGNKRTKAHLVRKFVPLKQGDFLDPESPELLDTEWRLMGTGWFDSVDIRLERGAERGYVVLVVEVKERNTVVIESLVAGLSESVREATDRGRTLFPWLGFKVTETNLAGLGIRLSGTALISEFQQGGRVDLEYPKLIKSEYGVRFGTFFLNGRELYGNEPLVSVPCGAPTCPGTSDPTSAIVRYRRGGFMVGTGKEFTPKLRYSLDWIGDIVSVLGRPQAASEMVGNEIQPIDFAIQDGKSFVSSLRFALTFDKRDDPGITKEGVLFVGDVMLGTRALGSDYDFIKIDVWVRRWWRLPWKHTIRIGFFGGATFGNTPFFYLFHISDLSDLIPSRFLEMQLDARPPPNLLDTSIENNYLGELAWRLDVGYDVPVYQRARDRGLREVNVYALIGLISLADLRTQQTGFGGINGYSGFSRFPLDLTFDFGFRFDTSVGVFQFGFSTILGFIRL
ncbi:MAG: BamA/TamA family outer membrane protein [Polyangiales bacterium]